MKRLMLLTILAAATLAACGQQVTPEPEPGIRCISYTDSEIYPQYRMTCWCEVEEGGDWVECNPPEALP